MEYIEVPSISQDTPKRSKYGIAIKNSKLFYPSFLALLLVESILAIVLGLISWQTVMINGIIMFTFVDFVSFSLILTGVVLMASFVVILWNRIRIQKKGFYAPIHTMIVRVNNEIPRERVNQQWTVGAWVSVRLLRIDHQRVTDAFNQHSLKFRDEDLKMWIEIEKEINGINGNGFFLNHERQKWFDDLEARYNR